MLQVTLRDLTFYNFCCLISHVLKNYEFMTNSRIYFVQAESEELARKVESLTTENVTLKSEINQLSESSEKLRKENETLMVLFT